MTDIHKRFEILTTLTEVSNLNKETICKLRDKTNIFCDIYQDIDSTELLNDTISFYIELQKQGRQFTGCLLSLYKDLLHTKSGLYKALCIALRIYLTIGASNAGAERSFSKLKLIKNYLRNSILIKD